MSFLLGEVSHENCSTFYLIRHAEKIRLDKSESNPDLNEKGLIRAEGWKTYFLDKGVSKIYSTNYKRTLNTVKPIANEKNIEIILYSPSDIEYDKFIEVKTTRSSSPRFFWSSNEIKIAKKEGEKYWIYLWINWNSSKKKLEKIQNPYKMPAHCTRRLFVRLGPV